MTGIQHKYPLGIGASPSRFFPGASAGRALPFQGIYLGFSLETCFVECIVRDLGAGGRAKLPVERSVVETRGLARVHSAGPLALVDLTGSNALVGGIPTDAFRARDHACGRTWGRAIFDHPDQPDGILFPSRLLDGGLNIAVHERAIPKLRADPVVAPLTTMLDYPDLIRKYRIQLIDREPNA